jgi:hypothetical protein
MTEGRAREGTYVCAVRLPGECAQDESWLWNFHGAMEGGGHWACTWVWECLYLCVQEHCACFTWVKNVKCLTWISEVEANEIEVIFPKFSELYFEPGASPKDTCVKSLVPTTWCYWDVVEPLGGGV